MRQVGKYQLIRKLATGGMAEVYLAKAAGPRGFEKTLVVKCILPHLAQDPAFVEMFFSEALLAARLTHPHIVQIFDFGEADGSPFIAMEYIDGPSLRTLIKRASVQGQPMSPAVCARLISHACEGLAFAHDFTDPDTGEAQGLIHRDVSADNILLSRQGAVKVVDFGIAKAVGQTHKTQSGVIKGKLSYMPPEQLRAESLDARADVYALGVVLYELLTFHKPHSATSDVALMHATLFQSPTPAVHHRPDIPEALQHILSRALAKDREQRYPDCHAFQSDLEDFILAEGRSVTAQQMAQLVQRITSGTGLPAQRLSTEGPSNPTPLPVEVSFPGETGTSTDLSTRPESSGLPVGSATTQLFMSSPVTGGTTFQESPFAAYGLAEERASLQKPMDPRWKRYAAASGVLLTLGGGLLYGIQSTTQVRSGPAPVIVHEASSPQPPPVTASVAPVSPVSPAPMEHTERNKDVSAAVVIKDAVSGPILTSVVSDPSSALAPAHPTPTGPPQGPRSLPRPGPRKPLLPKAMGSLDVRAQPYATVFVDERGYGSTPLDARVKLTEGWHTVTLNCSGVTMSRSIEVKPHMKTLVSVRFPTSPGVKMFTGLSFEKE